MIRFKMIRHARRALTALALTAPLFVQAADFAKGADVSWVSKQEAAGYAFYGDDGLRHDPFAMLKAKGTNAIRLRVWVNPANGWNDGRDTLYKAKRAAAQGQRIMIDFHYSDIWADPGNQAKPAAWNGHDISRLYTDVYEHTTGVLQYLKNNGIQVEWVQVGNEINSGMLLPEGSTSNFKQLGGLINSGYNAVKAVYPQAKVVVHLAKGHDNNLFRWFFTNLRNAGGKWDVTGMSHYPSPSTWSSDNAKISTNMADMVTRFGKPVIVAEVGMDWQQASTAKAMLADLMNKVKARGSNGLGVFYWEPQAYPGWEGYTLGALNNSGQFTIALDPY